MIQASEIELFDGFGLVRVQEPALRTRRSWVVSGFALVMVLLCLRDWLSAGGCLVHLSVGEAPGLFAFLFLRGGACLTAAVGLWQMRPIAGLGLANAVILAYWGLGLTFEVLDESQFLLLHRMAWWGFLLLNTQAHTFFGWRFARLPKEA